MFSSFVLHIRAELVTQLPKSRSKSCRKDRVANRPGDYVAPDMDININRPVVLLLLRNLSTAPIFGWLGRLIGHHKRAKQAALHIKSAMQLPPREAVTGLHPLYQCIGIGVLCAGAKCSFDSFEQRR